MIHSQGANTSVFVSPALSRYWCLEPRVSIGWILWWLYIVQLAVGPSFESLIHIQNNEIYKQVTGLLLFMYILTQFSLASARISNEKTSTAKQLNTHMWLGVFTPLVFYLHSTQLGFGYQSILGLILLSIVASGLLSPKLTKMRNKKYVVVWLIIHVCLAVTLPVLLAYHLYVIYFYS